FAADLSTDEPRLRTQLTYAEDKSYGGTANITSRVLMLLSAEGLIVRGHRRGGWGPGAVEGVPAPAWAAGPAGLSGRRGRGGAGPASRGRAGTGRACWRRR